MKYLAIFTLLFSSLSFAQEAQPLSVPEPPEVSSQDLIVPPEVQELIDQVLGGQLAPKPPKSMGVSLPKPDAKTQAAMDKMDKKVGDQRAYLQKWLWKWQKKMHLESWIIGIANAQLESFPNGAIGESDYDPKTNTGTVLVLSAEEYLRLPYKEAPKTLKAIRKDQEDTVLHELVHLYMRYAEDGQEEHVVQSLTSLILREK